jgi:hypothetical protein
MLIHRHNIIEIETAIVSKVLEYCAFSNKMGSFP